VAAFDCSLVRFRFYQRLMCLVNGEHREFACRRQCLLYTVHSHLKKKLKTLEHLVRKTEGPLSQVMRLCQNYGSFADSLSCFLHHYVFQSLSMFMDQSHLLLKATVSKAEVQNHVCSV
jgi:hypothetical protein